MTTPDHSGPRPDVLAERIHALGSRFEGVERRLEGLATKDELISLIKSRDDLTNSRLNDLSDDIRHLTANLANERAERMASDKENEDRSNRARTFALSAIGLVVTVVLGLIALINQVGGAPA